ncbi:aminotransferase class I/II-fold pyridoxal phosphate-dependent enzyme, partial [Escherichia coli]|nr:aminotransferase class I/II-fold pyridoxal phosphate-dependent enzyme [Escherichia coli]
MVINPGNPTGACMTRAEVEDMIKLAHRESLAIFADEVYQDNVYSKDRPFVPFRRVLMELQNSQDASEREIGSSVELVSFHSTS